MKIIISHPHGNQNTSKTVSALYKNNLLKVFWTTIAFPNIFNIFKKKTYNVDFKKIKLKPFKEFLRKIFIYLKFKKMYINDNSSFSVNAIYKDLDLKVSKYLKRNEIKNNVHGIYTYEDCALESFTIARKKNIKTFYDLTSPYWRLKKKIIEEELKIHPDLTLSSLEIMSSKKCANKDREIFLSDNIIVASSFSAKSLELYPEGTLQNISIIPYGTDTPKEINFKRRKINEKFKILFVGRPVISKGIHYLVEILNKLDFPWEVEIAGNIPEKPIMISEKIHKFFKDERCKFLGQIPYHEVKNKMKNNHAFLFPSLFEGFGQVILESMSAGLPLITTTNTGGNDLINHGKNGYLTSIRDVNSSKNILFNLFNDEELRLSIAENSFLNSKNYSWKNYEKNIRNLILNKNT